MYKVSGNLNSAYGCPVDEPTKRNGPVRSRVIRDCIKRFHSPRGSTIYYPCFPLRKQSVKQASKIISP